QRLTRRRLEQEEVTDLMNELAAKTEMPVDGIDGTANGQLAESRLLAHFALRRRVGLLPGLDVSLRKAPVLVAVANEQKERRATVKTEDDASGRGFHARRVAH